MLQDFSNKFLLELNRIQYRALRLVMEYRQSTPINVILCETKAPPLLVRFRYLGRNFLSRLATNSRCHFLESLE